MSKPDSPEGSWTLLTGHGRVLVEITRNPGSRIRDIAAVVDLTERTVQAIVTDLETAGTSPAPGPGGAPSTPSTTTACSGTPPRVTSRSARSSPCCPPPAMPPAGSPAQVTR